MHTAVALAQAIALQRNPTQPATNKLHVMASCHDAARVPSAQLIDATDSFLVNCTASTLWSLQADSQHLPGLTCSDAAHISSAHVKRPPTEFLDSFLVDCTASSVELRCGIFWG